MGAPVSEAVSPGVVAALGTHGQAGMQMASVQGTVPPCILVPGHPGTHRQGLPDAVAGKSDIVGWS